MPESDREQLDESTRRVFEPRPKRPLHSEDVREISENLTGFFAVLQGWALAERAGQPAVPRSR